ncbi:MAG TPA: GNAT family N-acetyltransferase [Deltaproteobacteria bacterium]|nr:GNAT family N-acetyltransferase [Deltaproteobacteria bacterium]
MQIRFADPSDAATIHRFIVELATYEREPDAVEIDPRALAEQLASEPPPFECLLIEIGGVAVGFALFFHNYSTWRGTRGLYLEDLYVQPSHRGTGAGRALMARLAQLARERGCARLEWAVLDWNTPAIAFYESLGAAPQPDWTLFRLSGGALEALAEDRRRS